MTCEQCHKPAPRLTHADGKWICYQCVPEWVWKMYPKSYRDNAMATLKRSAQARKNFGKEQHA